MTYDPTTKVSEGLRSTGLSRRSFNRLIAGSALAAPLIGTKAFGQAARTFKIGYVGPQSGPLGIFGTGDTYLIETIRANLLDGIDVGGSKMAVEIITADTQSDPMRASQITRDLINSESPDLILTHSTPETVNPVSDACEAAATPCLSTIAPWEAFYFGRGGKPGEQTFKWTFHFSFGVANFVNLYDGQWSTIETNRKVGALCPNDADGNAIRASLLPALAGLGWEIVDPGPYENMTQDFGTLIDTFKDAGVEIVVCFPFPPDFPVFWRQAAQRGLASQLKIMQMAKAGLFAVEMEALGDLGYGLQTGMYWHPAFPFASSAMGLPNPEIANGFEAATGKQWNQAVGASASLFDAAIALAAQAGDPKDKEAMAAAMPTLKADTAIGPIDFATGPVPNCTTTRLVGGQWNRATEGPWQFKLDITSNRDFPEVALTAPLTPYKIGG